jgi:hypothetical protein
MGTVKFTFLRENILFFEKIYGKKDPDEESTRKKFKADLAEFEKQARETRESAVQWRLSHIKRTYDNQPNGIHRKHVYVVEDAYVKDKDGNSLKKVWELLRRQLIMPHNLG